MTHLPLDCKLRRKFWTNFEKFIKRLLFIDCWNLVCFQIFLKDFPCQFWLTCSNTSILAIKKESSILILTLKLKVWENWIRYSKKGCACIEIQALYLEKINTFCSNYYAPLTSLNPKFKFESGKGTMKREYFLELQRQWSDVKYYTLA